MRISVGNTCWTLATLGVSLVAACGSASTDTGGGATTGAIALALSATSGSVARGAQATVTGTVTRSGSFTGTVAVAVTGAPSGVTGTVGSVATTGTSSSAVVTIAVDTTVAPGSYTLVVHATGSGVTEATANYALFIPASGSFAISTVTVGQLVPVNATNVAQGDFDSLTLNIARASFTGAITLSATGAPSGLTAAFGESTTTHGSTPVVFTANSGVAAGTYPITLHASAPGVATDQTLVVNVTVFAGAGTAVNDYSLCTSGVPIWAAYQDGTGPWTQVAISGGIVRFPIAQARGGLVLMFPNGSGFDTEVSFFSRREFTDDPTIFCRTGTPTVTGVSMTGTFAGYTIGNILGAGFGARGTSVTTTTTPPAAYTLGNMTAGMSDFIAERRTSFTTLPDLYILRRDQTVVNGGTIPVADFSSAEAFAPATTTVTYPIAFDGTLSVSASMQLNECSSATGYALSPASPTFTLAGLPAAVQRANDLLMVSISGRSGVHSFSYSGYFHTLAGMTLNPPSLLAAPTITVPAGNYKRLQFAFAPSADWTGDKFFSYNDGASRVVNIEVSNAYLGGSTGTVAMPVLTGTPGFLDSWEPANGSTLSWSYSSSGKVLGGGTCRDGTRFFGDNMTGTN